MTGSDLVKDQQSDFIRVLHDPHGSVTTLLDSAQLSKDSAFVLALGATETSNIAGISAAGITPEARRLTPAVDAEALILGRTVDGAPIPVSPAGIVSPVVITRACLQMIAQMPEIIDCGTFVSPKSKTVTAGTVVARCLSTGDAIDDDVVMDLFEFGCSYGQRLSETHDLISCAECVPGGTTTAMAVLTALGLDVRNLLSSSLPVSNHASRFNIVEVGLRNAGLSTEEFQQKPLQCVARVGDPMQAVVAGIVMTASQSCPVLLCGGSQMIAVYALAEALLKTTSEFSWTPNNEVRQRLQCADGLQQLHLQQLRRNTLVITTKWVALDQTANMKELARLTETPFACSCPDFNSSRHVGLRAYEQGNVKEGVGAGGAMALAHLKTDASSLKLMSAIDDCYDQLVVRQSCPEGVQTCLSCEPVEPPAGSAD